MKKPHWHILREPGVLTLARRLPPRFDVFAQTTFPALRKVVLAHEIRKDLWRALQGLRGFSPVIRVWQEGAGLSVRAGGGMLAGTPRATNVETRIAGLLADPALRSRWIRHARLTEGAR